MGAFMWGCPPKPPKFPNGTKIVIFSFGYLMGRGSNEGYTLAEASYGSNVCFIKAGIF
jgi:hypothetical protein